MLKKSIESRLEPGPYKLIDYKFALRKLTSLLFLCLFMIIPAAVAWADEGGGGATSGSVHWWQIVSGIIAIPVALLTGYLAWKQIRNFKKAKSNQNGVKVGVMNGAIVKNSKVGNVTGIDASGNVVQPADGNANVSVLNKGQITHSELGDVTGLKE
jgi:hypothetical protein